MQLVLTVQRARWVLCAAIVFIAGNFVHSVEHDFSVASAQTYAECQHCSIEHGVAVVTTDGTSFPSLATAKIEILRSFVAAAPNTPFQARAPPLS